MDIKSANIQPFKVEICSNVIKFILAFIGLSLLGWVVGAFISNSFDTSTWLPVAKNWLIGLILLSTTIMVGVNADDCMKIGD